MSKPYLLGIREVHVSCRRIWARRNGGTDSKDCDDCWGSKQVPEPEPEMCMFGQVLESKPFAGGRLVLYEKFPQNVRAESDRRYGVAVEHGNGSSMYGVFFSPDRTKAEAHYHNWGKIHRSLTYAIQTTR